MWKNYESGKEVDFDNLILKLNPRRPRAYGGFYANICFTSNCHAEQCSDTDSYLGWNEQTI